MGLKCEKNFVCEGGVIENFLVFSNSFLKWYEAVYMVWRVFFFSSRRRHTRLTCDWSSDVCSSDLAFHVRRTARERYGIDDELIGLRGDLAVADLSAIRQLAARMNAERPPEAPAVSAGEIGRASCRERV